MNPLIAQSSAPGATASTQTFMLLLVAMSLLPFLLTMVTSFAKLVITLGILRQAIGTPQIPPTSVLTGIALILSLHIMSPVAIDAWSRYESKARPDGVAQQLDAVAFATSVEESLRQFLERHGDPQNVELFRGLRTRLRADQGRASRQETPDVGTRLAQSEWRDVYDTLTIRAPSFVLTELTRAFQIGFLLFIPFLVLDLVVSNILLAMGMHMMQPTLVSLPLKILLFVLVDGWRLLIEGIVESYVP